MLVYSDKVLSEGAFRPRYILIDGKSIESVSSSKPVCSEQVTDLTGTYLMPGFINLDSHFVKAFPEKNKSLFSYAMKNIEYVNALSGVTTLYHSVYYSCEEEKTSFESCQKRISNIKKYSQSPLSIIDNKINLHFEIKSPETIENVKTLIDTCNIDLLTHDSFDKRAVSSRVKDEYIIYYMIENFALSYEAAFSALKKIRTLREESCIEELSYLIKIAHGKKIKLSTKFIGLLEKITTGFKDSFDILLADKEFLDVKTNASHYLAIKSDDVLAMTDDKLKQLLSGTDKMFLYAGTRPNSLSFAVFKIAEITGFARAVSFITSKVADALELENAGTIKENMPANIAAVRIVGECPVVVYTIFEGKKAISVNL